MNECDEYDFNVDKRSVRDHIAVLIKRRKRKIRAEEKASFLKPDPSELELALDDIMSLEEKAGEELAEVSQRKREQRNKEKFIATDIRNKAKKKLGETQKRQRDVTTKKTRRSGKDALDIFYKKMTMIHNRKRKSSSLRNLGKIWKNKKLILTRCAKTNHNNKNLK